MRTRFMAMTALLGLGLAVVVGCGRAGESQVPANDGTVSATATIDVVATATPVTMGIGEPEWATWQGASVSELLKTLPIVFVGHVDSVSRRWIPIYPAGTDFSGPTVEGKTPMSAPGPMLPYSDYSMTVVTPIRGDLSAGDEVVLMMGGGDFAQPDGQLRRWS